MLMSTGCKLCRFSGAFILAAALLCTGALSTAHAEQTQAHRKSSKAKKKTPPPPLPSGPTGPVQQMPLDSIAAVPPQVTFHDNQLTIVAPNSTLSDILRAIRKQTGADIDVPAAPERVVTNLGPGPARDVLADLLNGSRFNYVLLGSPGNEAVLTRVVLVPKQTQPVVTANNPEPQPGVQPGNPPPQAEEPDQSEQAMDAQDESAPDESAEQPTPEPEQSTEPPDHANVKTPQQMLQEMQQRQLMMQQNQQPVPGSGMPPHPPQQQ
jgi:hypothetical protein